MNNVALEMIADHSFKMLLYSSFGFKSRREIELSLR
jgi:hypothetical protein